jgi:hypothetical protein
MLPKLDRRSYKLALSLVWWSCETCKCPLTHFYSWSLDQYSHGRYIPHSNYPKLAPQNSDLVYKNKKLFTRPNYKNSWVENFAGCSPKLLSQHCWHFFYLSSTKNDSELVSYCKTKKWKPSHHWWNMM